MVDSKQALRRAARRAREAAPPSHDFGVVLAALLQEATRVASYVPLPSEPGLDPQQGWLLPIVLRDGDLDWAEHDGSLAAAGFGLPEPTGPRLGVGAIATCDLVIVPALLVDRAGNRLGKGRGCYDRALVRATGLTVALVGDDELVQALPTEPHDIPVHAVATPSLGVVRLHGKM